MPRRKCAVLLEYLPWADAPERYKRQGRRHLQSGTVEICYRNVPAAKKFMRKLRQRRVAEYINIYDGRRSNKVAEWSSKFKKRSGKSTY